MVCKFGWLLIIRSDTRWRHSLDKISLLLLPGLDINILRHLSHRNLFCEHFLGNVFCEKSVGHQGSLFGLLGRRPHRSDGTYNLGGQLICYRGLPGDIWTILDVLNVCVFVLASCTGDWLLIFNILWSAFISTEEAPEKCLFLAILFFPAIVAEVSFSVLNFHIL